MVGRRNNGIRGKQNEAAASGVRGSFSVLVNHFINSACSHSPALLLVTLDHHASSGRAALFLSLPLPITVKQTVIDTPFTDTAERGHKPDPR